MDAPPSPNHVFNHPEDDLTYDEEEFEEDPLEDPEEELEEEEEPEEAQQIDFDFSLWTRKRIRLRLSSSTPMRLRDHPTFHLLLRRELEDVEIRYTLMRMDKEQAERELRHLGALPYWLYEEAVRARVVDVRPIETIDVLAVYAEYQPPGSQGPPSGS
ncbi:hypothetical protein Tco_0718158 [Tanacetum coccineum]